MGYSAESSRHFFINETSMGKENKANAGLSAKFSYSLQRAYIGLQGSAAKRPFGGRSYPKQLYSRQVKEVQ